jgi:hypothetical protein
MHRFDPPALPPGVFDYGLDAVNVRDSLFTPEMFDALPDTTDTLNLHLDFNEILFSFEESLAVEGIDTFYTRANAENPNMRVGEEDLLSTEGYIFSPGRYLTAVARPEIGWDSYGLDAADMPNWLPPAHDEEEEVGAVLPGWPYEILYSTEWKDSTGVHGLRFRQDDLLSDAPGPIVADITQLTAALPGGPYSQVGLDGIDVLPESLTASVNLEPDGDIPTSFGLARNYPNPFSSVTTIRYNLPVACHVNLEIFNILGQHVVTLVDERQDAGYRGVRWDLRGTRGSKISSGIYFYRLEAGDFVKTEKMLLLR